MKGLIFVLISFFTCSVFSEDFRSSNWGMSLDEVKNSEKEIKLSIEDDYLWGSTVINGNRALVQYLFIKNKLIYSHYIITLPHNPNPEEYLKAFYSYQSILGKKYGKPKEDSPLKWNSDKSKFYEKNNKIGTALLIDDLWCLNSWETETSTISLMASSENKEINGKKSLEREITIDIEYQTKNKDLLKLKEEEAKNKLDKTL